jgi:nucleoid-associated protein YgaU
MADVTKVQQTVQSLNVPGVRNLNARLNGTVVEIHGQADSIAAKQNALKAITEKTGDLGIVNKIDVALQQSAPHPQPSGAAITQAAETAQRTHKVKKGETLSHIAQHYYGKASDYNRIFEANRDQLKDPDKIREGMTLRIP